MKVAGSVAIVTGAASGIGRSTALLLAQRGATVVAADVRTDELATLTAVARTHPIDLSSRAACEEMIASVERDLGRVDALVNNAGIGCHMHAADTTAEDVERVFAVNFFAPVWLVTAVLPGMLARRHGSIVNVTSVAGHLPNPREAAYSASKAALSMWSHGLAVDLHGTGVHAGELSPGPMDTSLWSTLETPPAYQGRLFSPLVAARAIVEMIEREHVHATAPRRYGIVSAMYPVLGRPMRWGLRRFDRRATRH